MIEQDAYMNQEAIILPQIEAGQNPILEKQISDQFEVPPVEEEKFDFENKKSKESLVNELNMIMVNEMEAAGELKSS